MQMNLNDTNLWMIIAFGVGFIANELAHHIERELEAKDNIQKKRKGEKKKNGRDKTLW